MSGQATLEDVLLGIETGKSFQTTEAIAGPEELGVLKVSAVTWMSFRPEEAKSVDINYVPDPRHRVKRGDLLISRANTKELVGAVVLVEADHPNRLLSDKTLRLIIDEERASKEYLLFALRTEKARRHIEHFATGTSDSMRNISQDVIQSTPIDLPGLMRQREIAARLKAQLAEVATARQAAQAQLADTDALRTAIFHEAFGQVVPVSVPPTSAKLPDGWSWRQLTDLAALESGHTPSRSRPDWWGGDISWISLTEIRALDGQWVNSTRLRTNADGIANSAARILPRGTVCLSRTASVGFVAIMGQPMATSQDFANWVCGEELDPEFLMFALIRSRGALRELATGATHKTIYMPTLSAFHICLPRRAEQETIVARLKAQLAEVETARQAAQTQLREIEALPGRLLGQAFSGLI